MGKHESPPFKMKVDGGRLVPATAYDQERLDTYRRGTVVNVRFTRDEQRIGEKKWHAALNRAVKQCKTPWRTASEASEAIKLSLGIVNLTKSVGGAWLQYTKSLTELDDPELDEAVELMFDILFNITGVDPAAWREQVKHIAAEEPQDARDASGGPGIPAEPETAATVAAIEQEPASGASPDADAAGSGESSPCTAAADLFTTKPAQNIPPLKDQLVASLRIECIRKALMTASDNTLSREDRDGILKQARYWWEEKLPPPFVKAVFDQALRVSAGEIPTPAAKNYLERLP